jgi:hypothetical protein
MHRYAEITLTISEGRAAMLLNIQFFLDVTHNWASSSRYFEGSQYLRNVDSRNDTASRTRRLESLTYIGLVM